MTDQLKKQFHKVSSQIQHNYKLRYLYKVSIRREQLLWIGHG